MSSMFLHEYKGVFSGARAEIIWEKDRLFTVRFINKKEGTDYRKEYYSRVSANRAATRFVRNEERCAAPPRKNPLQHKYFLIDESGRYFTMQNMKPWFTKIKEIAYRIAELEVDDFAVKIRKELKVNVEVYPAD